MCVYHTMQTLGILEDLENVGVRETVGWRPGRDLNPGRAGDSRTY